MRSASSRRCSWRSAPWRGTWAPWAPCTIASRRLRRCPVWGSSKQAPGRRGGLQGVRWLWINTYRYSLLGDEHPFATYFDVHQGYMVLTHSHVKTDSINWSTCEMMGSSPAAECFFFFRKQKLMESHAGRFYGLIEPPKIWREMGLAKWHTSQKLPPMTYSKIFFIMFWVSGGYQIMILW